MAANHSYCYVLDCSVTMAWLFTDETTPKILALRNQLKKTSAIVPELWPLEVANVLWVSEKKKRINHFQSSLFKKLLTQLPIVIDDKTKVYALGRILELAREFNITPYDASYLELSFRLGCPLATLDKTLIQAAKKSGIPILP